MSKDKRDLPKTGKNDPEFNHATNKPKRGELFMRTAKGSVQLKQTLKSFGRKPRDPKTGVEG